MPMRLAWGGDLDSEEAPFPEAQGCKEWYDSWRWGWAEETWKPFLEALCPPLSVLCGSFHSQPGFLMAILGYNEERYGLDRCNMIAFYPRNSAVKEEGIRPKCKTIEQGHMADHVLASISAVYADFRLAASKAVRKRHLFRATSREAEPLAKLVKNDSQKPAGIVAAGSSAGGAADTGAGSPGAGTAAAGSSHVTKATMFIGVFGNSGPKATLIPLPADKSAEDSDTEPCGGDAGNLSHAVVSKRNMASMTKNSVKIMKSSGPEGVGNGVFTACDMSAGWDLPVKGVWFTDLDELNTWLKEQHPLTAQAMSRKIIEVHFSVPPEANKVTYYFAMTGLAGYVNAYTGIIQRPNAQLVFNPDRPLGQHSLRVCLVGDLPADREILIAYGARHALKDRQRPGPKLKRRKKSAAPAAEAAAADA